MITTQQSVAARIKALLAKTTENGCTEAEAMSAAAKARELMDRYHIDHGEVGMEEEGAWRVSAPRTNWKSHRIEDRLGRRIAEFCDCKVWMGSSKSIVFFGLRSDADFAGWLSANLAQFAQASVFTYMAQQPRAKRGPDLFDLLADVIPLDAKGLFERETAFVIGLVGRINERLLEMIKARREGMGDGRSLVVVKSAIVAREFAKLGITLGTSRAVRRSSNDGGAHNAGRAAGERASFGRPLNGGGQVGRIGHG